MRRSANTVCKLKAICRSDREHASAIATALLTELKNGSTLHLSSNSRHEKL